VSLRLYQSRYEVLACLAVAHGSLDAVCYSETGMTLGLNRASRDYLLPSRIALSLLVRTEFELGLPDIIVYETDALTT
jgi:hypothetical protein